MKGLVDYSDSDESENEDETTTKTIPKNPPPTSGAQKPVSILKNSIASKGSQQRSSDAPKPPGESSLASQSRTTASKAQTQTDKLKAIATRSPLKTASRKVPMISSSNVPSVASTTARRVSKENERADASSPAAAAPRKRPFSLNMDAASLRKLDEQTKRAMSGQLVTTPSPTPSPKKDNKEEKATVAKKKDVEEKPTMKYVLRKARDSNLRYFHLNVFLEGVPRVCERSKCANEACNVWPTCGIAKK